jgi:hypothetical protein
MGSLERKITEALFIQQLKPDLNGKYEQLSILDFVYCSVNKHRLIVIAVLINLTIVILIVI